MSENIEKLLVLGARTVEASLGEYLSGDDEKFGVIYDAMRYSALGGGKRLRPFLTLQFAMLGACESGKDIKSALDGAMPYACALEMIHTYSLIHDDLPCMDNDDLRRGKPTSHKKYGEAIAVLAGDALLTKAFGTAAGNPYMDSHANCSAVKLLSKCAGADGMIGGQVLDILGEREPFDMATLRRLQALKTGELIRAAAVLGTIAGGGSEELIKASEKYAEGIGRAFQVIDDILDATGTEAVLGKPIGSDKQSGKTTFLTFMSVNEAFEYARELTEKAKLAIKEYASGEILSELADYLLTRKK